MALKLPKTPFLEGVKTNQSYFLSFLKLCNYFVFTIFAFIVRILANFFNKKDRNNQFFVADSDFIFNKHCVFVVATKLIC